MTKVLVIAPRFPAINQPWIDTYLEALIKKRIEFGIYTQNAANTQHGSKVHELDLKRAIVDVDLRHFSVSRGLLREFRNSPIAFVLAICRAIALCARTTGHFIAPWIPLKRLAVFISCLRVFRPFGLIHSHTEVLGFDFVLLAKLLRIPFILTFHGLPPSGVGQLRQQQRSFLYANARLVFVNTEFAKSQVMTLGAHESTIRILPQGLPVPDFPYVERHPIQSTAHILTVGRFHRDKGQAYAILALKRLLDRGHRVFWSFVGVGPDRERLIRIANRLGVSEHVSLNEGLSSDDLRHLYQTNDLFVLPSVHNPHGHVETQGVVLQEAQASGCVPVATRTGGIPECINHMQDGMLVRHRSSRAIADAIHNLILDPVLLKRLRLCGRANVETRFSSEMIGATMAEYIRGIAQ